MKLARLYAFEVFPGKGETNPSSPAGGPLNADSPIRSTLRKLMSDVRLDSATPISFQISNPQENGSGNPVRELVMRVCFGKTTAPANAATELATRLSSTMDQRSNPFLFLVSSFSGEGSKASRAVLWAFPKDKVFKFNPTPNGANVEVIGDVFSVSSRLRKAAMFEGTNHGNSFWEGRMLDLQSGTTRLWIEHFLQCRLSVSGSHGTRQLAEYVAKTFRELETSEARDEMFDSVLAMQNKDGREISFLKFSDEINDPKTKDEFLALVPQGERATSFSFDRELFQRKVGFRVFKMQDGVVVSAPGATINESVKLSNGQLRYRGRIESEALKRN